MRVQYEAMTCENASRAPVKELGEATRTRMPLVCPRCPCARAAPPSAGAPSTAGAHEGDPCGRRRPRAAGARPGRKSLLRKRDVKHRVEVAARSVLVRIGKDALVHGALGPKAGGGEHPARKGNDRLGG